MERENETNDDEVDVTMDDVLNDHCIKQQHFPV
jgi:hypothetical protein